MESILDIIQKRHSVRSYSDREIEKNKIIELQQYFNSNRKGPFGSSVRFQLVNASSYNEDELKKFGTYGMIRGARSYIVGTVLPNDYALEDFGYCMEKNILRAIGLGLGTCWLGGSLNRRTFAETMGIRKDEIIAAVTPVGYPEPGSKGTLVSRMIVFGIGSKKRKAFEDIFYNTDGKPLTSKNCENYTAALEAVRLGPSAGNLQPWRIVKENDKFNFHFYMEENTAYNKSRDVHLQNIDMGIAMCHFELAAKELNLKGKWEIDKPLIDMNRLKYTVSWMG